MTTTDKAQLPPLAEIAALLDDYAGQSCDQDFSAANATRAMIDARLSALSTVPAAAPQGEECPYPIRGDKNAAECIANGHCGCGSTPPAAAEGALTKRLQSENKMLRCAIKKIAAVNDEWGPFPEANNDAWGSMAIVTAREALAALSTAPAPEAVAADVLDYVKGIYDHLQSVAPAGAADEAFRLPPSPTRAQRALLDHVQGDASGERATAARPNQGLGQADRSPVAPTHAVAPSEARDRQPAHIEHAFLRHIAAEGALTPEAAQAMGETGSPAVESERLLFEAYMRGHCWALCATWDGKGYRSDAEQGGELDPRAMATRRLWAVWRDRAALSTAHAPAKSSKFWENFPAYLIDHCEGETITEEGLQRALSDMLADPKYAAQCAHYLRERTAPTPAVAPSEARADRKLLEALSKYIGPVLQELQFERGTSSLAAHNLRLCLIEVEKALRGERNPDLVVGVGFPLAALATPTKAPSALGVSPSGPGSPLQPAASTAIPDPAVAPSEAPKEEN